jgi:hypothetical protein
MGLPKEVIIEVMEEALDRMQQYNNRNKAELVEQVIESIVTDSGGGREKKLFVIEDRTIGRKEWHVSDQPEGTRGSLEAALYWLSLRKKAIPKDHRSYRLVIQTLEFFTIKRTEELRKELD